MSHVDDGFASAMQIAQQCLGITGAEATTNSRRLGDIDAYYFWQPGRGGGALIVGPDGSALFANSSVSLEKHKEEFRNGRRTNPDAFGL